MDNAQVETSHLSVSEFYANKSVFITGGTGFLGKVLIEKLLYSCENIDNIYLLLREENEYEANERLSQLINSPIFARLREEKPQNLAKIKPIRGDITVFNLGLTSDQELLLKKVSVVFHLAATIRFDEPLKKAFTINLEGTREVLNTFKKNVNLKSFVYVSTAFSNANREDIDECIYPSPRTLQEVYRRLKDEEPDKDITEFLNGRPNTYIFTKALTENLIAEEHGVVPAVIVRPSIITPVAGEPIKGWIDNWMGITSFILAIAKGWTRVLHGRRDNVLDIIPVDYVVNLTIVAATTCKSCSDVPVFNICSSSSNPISYGLLGDLLIKESVRQKFNDFPLFGLVFLNSATLVAITIFFLETIPAYLADFWLKITSKTKRSISFVKAQSKQSKIRENLRYFQSRSWRIKSTRTSELYASLSGQDRQMFPCEPADLNWSTYVPTYFNGIRRYLLESLK